MNQTVITGNLTADIETKEIESKAGDQHLCKFTLASNEGDRVVFLPVEAWNMPHLAEHLFKGSKALISGSLKQDNWENDSGEKRSRLVLTAYRVEFLDPAPEHRNPPRDGREPRDSSGRKRAQRSGRKQRDAA